MDRLILKVDSPSEIVLEAPRAGIWIVGAALAAMAVAVRFFLPGRWIAAGLLGLLALAVLTGALQLHRLRLDLERRTWAYHHGWRFAPPARSGTFDDIVTVFIDRCDETPSDLPGSRQRSRRIGLEIEVPDRDGAFPLGFPMGPRVAAEQAADFGRRLGVAVTDRTATQLDLDPEETS